MDVEGYIATIEAVLAEARPVPLSASVMVNRTQLSDLLTELRGALPEEVRQARWVLKEREEMLAQATRDSQQILDDARMEAERLASETEIIHQARRQADRLLDEAGEQARVLRLEAEDYVDGKLANFEVVLQKTLTAVENGRERLRGRLVTDDLTDPDDTEADSQFYDQDAR